MNSSVGSSNHQLTSTILLPKVSSGNGGSSSDYISKRNRSEYNYSNEVENDDRGADNSLLYQSEKKLRYSDEWSESQFTCSSSSSNGQEYGKNFNDNSNIDCNNSSRERGDLNSCYCSSDSNDETNAMKISPLKTNTENLSSPSKNCYGIAAIRNDRTNQCISPNLSTPSNNNLSQKRVDDYYSTPKSELKNRPLKEFLHDRPQKNLTRSLEIDDSIQDNKCISDCAEPMSVDDTCECCFREVEDTVISRRCCDCTKIGCTVCLQSCESCSETFCSRCCTINYSCSYERMLCFDCNHSGR
jgi:hypothetical protein